MRPSKKVLAIIPARSGSKGLPGKNLRIAGGKPLLAWSIEQALCCKEINEVVVSTDCKKIARVARSLGAKVPFIRPKKIASDKATSIEVILHCLEFYEGKNIRFDIIALFEPTSPLRKVSDFSTAFHLLRKKTPESSVVSVCRAECFHPYFSFIKSKSNSLQPLFKRKERHVRRQDLPPVYFPEGSMYISYVKAIKDEHSFFHKNTFCFEIPRSRSLEVDEIHDLICADALLKKTKKQ